jgi:predicted nucleotidyltransferase
MLNPDFKDMLSMFDEEENAERVIRALIKFGAPMEELAVKDFVTRDLVFQIGIEPNRIDLLTSIDGVDFPEAWENRITAEVGGVAVPVLGLADLIRNKQAIGRLRDLADVEELKRLHPE